MSMERQDILYLLTTFLTKTIMKKQFFTNRTQQTKMLSNFTIYNNPFKCLKLGFTFLSLFACTILFGQVSKIQKD